MNVNRVFLAGHLTRDPALRHTPNQTPVCEFGIAINRRYRDSEETTFVECVAWGKTAEIIRQHLHKGAPIFIEGRLTYSQWEDRQSGKKRSRLSVTVERFHFVGKRPAEKPANPSQKSDDDIPF